MTSLLRTMIHYIRLCWNCICSVFRAGGGDGGGGGGIRLSLFKRGSGPRLTFDNGMQVDMGRQIAEGGFSYVFEAFPIGDSAAAAGCASGGLVLSQSSSTLASDATDSRQPPLRHGRGEHHGKYALKRINCSDHELVQACRHEAGVHRSLPSDHPNLLELLGLKFDRNDDSMSSSSNSSSSSRRRREQHNEYNVCYMLFPYIPLSLRGEITQRNILDDPDDLRGSGGTVTSRRRRPFAVGEVLQLLGGLVDALTAMHDAGLSHRDVKLENVLLRQCHHGYSDHGGAGVTRTAFTPVVMDFGSAGPLSSPPLATRRQAATIAEEAASNTTMPYRPPELFEGGIRHGEGEVMDYGKVDVWGLGCVLFGLMHGASPFEAEFLRDHGGNDDADRQYGLLRIVECTRLKILGDVPFPPWAAGNSGKNEGRRHDGRNGRYPVSIYRFVRYMTQQDRAARPGIREVATRFGELHLELSGRRWMSYEEGRRSGDGGHDDVDGKGNLDDFDSLIASRDFV